MAALQLGASELGYYYTVPNADRLSTFFEII